MRDQTFMNDFIEEQGGTYLCNAFSKVGCDTVELALIEELSKDPPEDYQKQLDNIEGAGDDYITEDLKKRKKLLKQLIAKSDFREEL